MSVKCAGSSHDSYALKFVFQSTSAVRLTPFRKSQFYEKAEEYEWKVAGVNIYIIGEFILSLLSLTSI